MFTLIGYDKDHDVYDILSTQAALDKILRDAETLIHGSTAHGVIYRSSAGDPYDWLELYENYGTDTETRLQVLSL